MNDSFMKLFTSRPKEIIEGDYFFGADVDGDAFDDANEDFWLNQNGFKNNWEGKSPSRSDNFLLCEDICDRIVKNEKPYMEVACGLGMGLTPIILAKNPSIPCLATDACSRLIYEV